MMLLHIIEQLWTNHEEAASHMLLTRPDKAQKGLLWQVQILMGLFYLYIILVALAYVKFSLTQEGKVYTCSHALRSGMELPSLTEYGYENDTDTGHNKPKIASHLLHLNR